MVEKHDAKKYVNDLNWVNNTLHDFVTRVAFMEITEQYLNKHKTLKEDTPMIWSIYNSMANSAVLQITNIYDGGSKTLSIHYLLKWIQKNNELIKKHVHAIQLDFSKKDVERIKKNIEGFGELVKKFKNVRNELVGHNNRNRVETIDIRRNLMNNKKIDSEELFIQSAEEYLEEALPFLLDIEDFVSIKDHTIEVLGDLKNLLKMPDRIFGKSGNLKEWDSFYKFQKKEASEFFELLLQNSSHTKT